MAAHNRSLDQVIIIYHVMKIFWCKVSLSKNEVEKIKFLTSRKKYLPIFWIFSWFFGISPGYFPFQFYFLKFFVTSDASLMLFGHFNIELVIHCTEAWSEWVTKPPCSSEQIEVNLSFLEAFGYILSRKVFLKFFKAWITPLNQLQKSKKCSKIRKFGN